MSRLRGCVFSLMAIAVAGMLLAGCASSQAAQDEVGLAGDWKLTSILSSGSEQAIPQDVTITLSADLPDGGSHDYDVYGFSGVNNYSGPVVIDEPVYEGGPFAITQMAGPPALEDFERLYLETLTDADRFSIAPDRHGMAIAKTSGETALLFERLKFDGTHWLLTGYFNGTGVRSVDQSKAVPELAFGTKLDISGFSGTNYVVGAYDVNYESREISFAQVGITEGPASTREAAIPEQEYLDLLGKATHYVWSGDTLQLIGKDGNTLLVFDTK